MQASSEWDTARREGGLSNPGRKPGPSMFLGGQLRPAQSVSRLVGSPVFGNHDISPTNLVSSQDPTQRDAVVELVDSVHSLILAFHHSDTVHTLHTQHRTRLISLPTPWSGQRTRAHHRASTRQPKPTHRGIRAAHEQQTVTSNDNGWQWQLPNRQRSRGHRALLPGHERPLLPHSPAGSSPST